MCQVAQGRPLDLAAGKKQTEADRQRDADEDDDPDRPEQLRTEAAAEHLRPG